MEQTDDLLIQFMGVTNVEDVETALHYLEASNYDVQNAVDLYLSNSTTTATTSQSSSTRMQDDSESVRAPMEFNEQASRLYDSFSPTTTTTTTGGAHTNPFFHPAMAQYQQQQQQQQQERVRPSTFQGSEHAHLFTIPSNILFQGSYNAALNHAAQSEKWLIVSVHDESEFACHELIRDVWRDETVQDLIACFYTLWQCDVSTNSGTQFLRLHGLLSSSSSGHGGMDQCPMILFIDPRTGELIKRLNGKMTKHQMIEHLQQFVDTHSLQDDYMRIAPSSSSSSSTTSGASSATTTNQGLQYSSTPTGVSSSSSDTAMDMDDEEQMIQAAIRASLQEQSSAQTPIVIDEDEEEEEAAATKQQQFVPKSPSLLEQPQSQQQQHKAEDEQVAPQEEETATAAFVVPDVNVDEYLLPSGGTRVCLMDGTKRNIYNVAPNTPLAVIYHLYMRILENNPKPFRVCVLGKEIEPALDKTIESENLKNASFKIVPE